MEADWSAEIGPGLPEIIVPWSAQASGETIAWVDLRQAGPRLEAAIQSIPSAAAEPALAAALRQINLPGSSWFTSKCDLWTASPAEGPAPDPYEFDAADLAPTPLHLCASYIDILTEDPELFPAFSAHEDLLRSLTTTLRTDPVRHGRVDLVLRSARIHQTSGFAFTAYAAGCGISPASAHQAWTQILAQFIAALPI